MADDTSGSSGQPATPRVRLEMTEAPSQQVTAKASTTHDVRDARGRRLTLKRPGVLAQYRLVEALGGETAKNEVYMGMVLPLLFVAAVDGDPMPPPVTKREIDALIQQLDNEGISAVMEGVEQHFGDKSAGSEQDRIKN